MDPIEEAWEIYKATGYGEPRKKHTLEELEAELDEVKTPEADIDPTTRKILEILKDPSHTIKGKQNLFSKMGIKISTAEIKQLLIDNKIPLPKSPHKSKKAKKVYETTEGVPARERTIGEGVHTYEKPHRRVLAREGYEIPKGEEVHHLSGVHTENLPENLATATPEEHEAFHMMHPTKESIKGYLKTPVGEDPKTREMMYGLKEPQQWAGFTNPSKSVKELANKYKAVSSMDKD